MADGDISAAAGPKRLALTLHPGSACPALEAIEVEVARPASGALVVRYLLTGDIGRLRLPPPVAPARTDGLWRHTCFEVFIGVPGEEAYREFNCAPSTAWAAYAFTGYREVMTPLALPTPPRIETHADPDRLTVHVMLEIVPASLPAAGPWRLGLSAVIEDIDGVVSYWAVAHPPGPPDFHHRDCFALEVVALDRP